MYVKFEHLGDHAHLVGAQAKFHATEGTLKNSFE
jgi:hypothetical protein